MLVLAQLRDAQTGLCAGFSSSRLSFVHFTALFGKDLERFSFMLVTFCSLFSTQKKESSHYPLYGGSYDCSCAGVQTGGSAANLFSIVVLKAVLGRAMISPGLPCQ